jgi:lipopolysaccharide/colanic/teichoic acid biosynthesis glycosyltransferase
VRAEIPVINQGSPSYVGKRAFDLLFASVLTVLLLPLMALVAVAIKLDSRGGALFRSPRIGRNGKPFGMLKFRTMVDGAHEHRDSLRHMSDAREGLFKLKSDPRVTRVGGFLRSTSLDELPQLFHVLSGTMSLVGPRPLPPEEDALIREHGMRDLIRPGMTGPWQIAGAWQIPLDEMVDLDDTYVTSWSFRTDLKLLVQTVRHVLRRRGV